MKRFFTLFLIMSFLGGFFSCFAQIPAGYYQNASGKKGYQLQRTLTEIISPHISCTYAALWTNYYYTDRKENGKIWDIYSDNPNGGSYEFDFGTQQCINVGSAEGVCYNQEHIFCQSWFGGGTGAPYTDLFHIYPVDGYINSTRNNFAFGIVTTPARVFQNGSKFGANNYPEAPATSVFEPIDEYKGDIARTFFYMATRYMLEDNNFTATSPMTVKSQLQPWAIKMLLSWHYLDPVSDKERQRNNAIYAIQHNRNPFIDYPELVAKIWDADSLNPFILEPEPIPPKPQISCFELVGSNTLKLAFSTSMVAYTVENIANYTISGHTSISSVSFIQDTAIIHLGGLFEQNNTYQLSVKNLLATNMFFVNDTILTFNYHFANNRKPLIAWTFDQLQSKPNTPKVINANFNYTDYPAVFYADGSYQSSDFIAENANNQLDAFAGTELGDPRTPPVAGSAIALANVSANGKSIVLKFSTKKHVNIFLSMAVRVTSTGFNTHAWEWSLDGVSYNNIPNTNTCPVNAAVFEVTTLDLKNLSQIDDQDSVFLRLIFDGARGATGNNRLDNITIHATDMSDLVPNYVKSKDLYIYPNPINTTLYIKIENNELMNNPLICQMIDYNGRVLLEKKNISSFENIDVSTFSAGMYIIKIISPNKKIEISEKLIIAH